MASLNAVFKLNDQFSKAIEKINRSNLLAEKSLMGVSSKADGLNNKFASMDAGASRASGGLKKLGAALGGLYGIKQAMSISDEYMNTRARIDLVNDGLQTTQDIQDNIFLAAERSKGSYMEMSKAVSKMGMLAGDAFGSTQEIINFTEMIQKSFKVGGASKGEQDSGMYQLTQAMAAGKLQGDEFASISENAPMISKAISSYLDVPIGKLKEMSSDGLITADIIKGAMFNMSDEINAKFDRMPKTWADIGTSIKNYALRSFEAVIEKSSELINTEGFNAFVMGIKGGIDIIGRGFLFVVEMVSWFSQVVVDNWNIVQPILIFIAAVAIPFMILQLYIAAKAWLKMWGSALLPIVIVAAAIALVAFALIQMGVTTDMIIGGVCGTFSMLFALIYNGFALCYNVVGSFAEFMINVFIDPVYAVKKLFYDMSLYIYQIIQSIAQQLENMINCIPGVTVNITSGLNDMVSFIEGQIDGLSSEKNVVSFDKLEYKNLNDSFNSGYNWGNSVVGGLSSGGLNIPSMPQGGGIGDYMNNGALPITNGSGGAGSLDVSIDKEDIKYLKDIAERDYVAKYTSATLAPNVQITFGDINETADANKVAGIVERIIREEIAVACEG